MTSTTPVFRLPTTLNASFDAGTQLLMRNGASTLRQTVNVPAETNVVSFDTKGSLPGQAIARVYEGDLFIGNASQRQPTAEDMYTYAAKNQAEVTLGSDAKANVLQVLPESNRLLVRMQETGELTQIKADSASFDAATMGYVTQREAQKMSLSVSRDAGKILVEAPTSCNLAAHLNIQLDAKPRTPGIYGAKQNAALTYSSENFPINVGSVQLDLNPPREHHPIYHAKGAARMVMESAPVGETFNFSAGLITQSEASLDLSAHAQTTVTYQSAKAPQRTSVAQHLDLSIPMGDGLSTTVKKQFVKRSFTLAKTPAPLIAGLTVEIRQGLDVVAQKQQHEFTPVGTQIKVDADIYPQLFVAAKSQKYSLMGAPSQWTPVVGDYGHQQDQRISRVTLSSTITITNESESIQRVTGTSPFTSDRGSLSQLASPRIETKTFVSNAHGALRDVADEEKTFVWGLDIAAKKTASVKLFADGTLTEVRDHVPAQEDVVEKRSAEDDSSGRSKRVKLSRA